MRTDAAANLLRAGVDKLLKSDAVMGALRRQLGRYVEVLDLGCTMSGVTAVVRPLGFAEEVRIVLTKAKISDDGMWIRPLDISADREGVDALLRDLVRGRRFELPGMARPFTGMLKKLLEN